MAETLNRIPKNIRGASYDTSVGAWRHASHRYDFSVDGGAQTTFDILTITGDVLLCVVGLCQTLMNSGGAATIELGITGNTAVLIAQTTATGLDQSRLLQVFQRTPLTADSILTGITAGAATGIGDEIQVTCVYMNED